ncbi:hypothetical protein EDC01DRAFT_782210 [Geopyxis carbonaria]|nr:hypothetical protein EDC01DRAFT_782210 [Geopyxis carbonaria]
MAYFKNETAWHGRVEYGRDPVNRRASGAPGRRGEGEARSSPASVKKAFVDKAAEPLAN